MGTINDRQRHSNPDIVHSFLCAHILTRLIIPVPIGTDSPGDLHHFFLSAYLMSHYDDSYYIYIKYDS